MQICLIKRGKIVHCGFEAKNMGKLNKYSVCNRRWNADDKISIGEESEVTCKKCQKILAKSDENGHVTL